MKSKVLFTFLILATLTALLSVSGLAGVGPLANPALQSGVPTVVSYQGHVTVGSSAYNGTGYFKVAIVNAAGDSTYWSNDGSSEDGGEPTNGTPLPVSNGMFNALLGDTSLTNMTQPLSASVFSGTERYLRVWFSSDNINFQHLSPDQRIAAVPYALQAQQAVNADTLDNQQASDFASTGHAHAGLLPAGAMVLSRTINDTTLIDAGFSYTGMVIESEWAVKAFMPTGRDRLAASVVNGVIYAIGGQSFSVSIYETANEAYDPATNTWSSKAPMPTGRYGLAAAAVDGVIYAIGGQSSTGYENANEAYDPDSNTWTTKADMPTGRYNLSAATVDGVVYTIGGESSSSTYETKNEAYNPVDNSWSVKADMLTGRSRLAAAAVDGVIYAIGGGSLSNSLLTANEAYTPVTNSWKTKMDMPTGRHYLAAAMVDSVIYAIGGEDGSTYSVTNEAYYPVSNTWYSKSDMHMLTGRERLATVAVDGVIYAIGGRSLSTSHENLNEAYTPAMYVYIKD